MEVVLAVPEVFKFSALRILTKYILNIKDEDIRQEVDLLKVGDELCRERMVPMSSQLIKKVIQIYKNSFDTSSSIGSESYGKPIIEVIRELVKKRFHNRDSENFKGDTPLMKALNLGLMDMVWGFIECAKQTNSNLLTRETGDHAVQQFLWLLNGTNGETAFDVAVANNQLEVASLLLNEAPVECLESQLYLRGKTLLPLLNNDPKYDRIILCMLDKDKRGELKSHRIDVSQPESNKRREIFGHGLPGSNPNKDTILHLVSRLGDLESVKEILKEDPSIISCHNSNGETPAYVAAREGHIDILQTMFQYAKQENEDIERIVIRRMDKNSALHIAIQNHHVEIVFFLVEQIPQLANHINDYSESPLYLAAERKYDVILELILTKCEDIAVAGPNGKTALHVAAISDSPECIKYLLNKRRDLLNKKDEYDWTPLHYAVYHNSSLATTELLKMDNSIGYDQLMTEDGINTSAIHIAASRGHYETMVVLMSQCPGLSELIDDKGRNILHVAVENKKKKVIENIFQDESLTSLINQKDSNGNTPIHLLVASDFEIMEKVMDFRVNLNVLNNEKQTPLDRTSSNDERERLIKRVAMRTSIHTKARVASANVNKYNYEKKESGHQEEEPEGKRKEAEAQFKIAENLVVVVTLIATASFAAGITLPGGLHSDNGSKHAGTPFLLGKAAFIVFMITNALAFSCSSAVLLIYIALLIYRNRSVEASLADLAYIDDRIVDMYFLTAFALVTMAIAFITAVYVVLTPSLALAICICVMSILTILLGVRVSMANKDKKRN